MHARVLSTALFFTSGLGVFYAQGIVSGAGYTIPAPVTVAPGQLVTFFVSGLGPVPQSINATGIPISNTLGGITAVLKQFNPSLPVPIFAIEPVSTCENQATPGCGTVAAITVQIPFEMRAENPNGLGGVPIGLTQLVFSGFESALAVVDLHPIVDQIHVLRTCDEVVQHRAQPCQPIVTHADGTLVTADAPAKAGEQIVIYAVGLGGTQPYVPTGQAATAGAATTTAPMVQFDNHPNALPSRPLRASSQSPVFAGVIANYVGLYQVNVVIPELPAGTSPCSPSGLATTGIASNVTVSIGGAASFDGAALCVQPGS